PDRGAMVYRGPNRRRQLSPLRGEDSPPDASPRRHRRHGQSRQPQRQSRSSAPPKLFFLPKYSPDLNPIEQVFAKLKHLLRRAAARTVETVCAAIGKILGEFTSEECANYFRNSGYAPT